MVAGSAPSATAIGNGWPGLATREVAEVQRAAAVGQPAHDDLARPDHLLAVDAQVLPQRAAAATACGPRVTTRPQVISGPASPGQQVCTGSAAEVDVRRPRAPPPGRARWRCSAGFMSHSALAIVQQLAGVLQALGRLGLLQAGQQPADVAQLGRPTSAPMPRATRRGCRTDWSGTECCNRSGFSNSSAGPPARSTVADCRHFQARRHRFGHPVELAQRSSCADEVAQVAVLHTHLDIRDRFHMLDRL